MTDVTIDRLVLDLPVMDGDAARVLALGVAEALADAGATGDHDVFRVELGAETLPPERLAAHIARSILQRIG